MTTHSTRQPGHLVGLSKAHSIHVYGMVAYNYHKNAPFMQEIVNITTMDPMGKGFFTIHSSQFWRF